MIYILSTTLNENKRICYELKALYGVGLFQSNLLCNFLNFGNNSQIKELTQTQIHKLLKQIEKNNLIIENDLQKQKKNFISHLIRLKCYRGKRHVFKLPVRGQRTRTNAKTVRKIKNKQ